MKLPRDLSGAQLIRILCRRFGYHRVNQEGSHVILEADHPHQRLSIPDHRSLRPGTLNAILNSVARSRGVDKSTILAEL